MTELTNQRIQIKPALPEAVEAARELLAKLRRRDHNGLCRRFPKPKPRSAMNPGRIWLNQTGVK